MRGPDTARVGQPVTFDGSESFDPDGAIESYLFEISYGDEPADEVLQSASPRLVHTFSDVGLWVVVLTVVDDDGTKTSAPELVIDVR